MDKLLRTVGTAGFTLLVVPVLGGILHDAIQQPLIAMLTGWLTAILHQWWYWYALAVVGGFAVGVWLDWLARRFDRSRDEEYVSLGEDLEGMKRRLDSVVAWQKEGYFDFAGMMVLSAELSALKVSLRRRGIEASKKDWTPPPDRRATYQDAVPYISEHMAYITRIGPLLRRGHIHEARSHAAELLGIPRRRFRFFGRLGLRNTA